MSDWLVEGSLEGSTVGRYTVGRLIGRGGMGEVYMGNDPALQRVVVIKRLHPGDEFDPDRSRRLRREAQLHGQLSHPNIVRVYDIVAVDSTDYIISEYIDGGTLAALSRRRRLTVVEALTILRQVALGMAFSHTHGIIHRDLKSENVLISADGTVKITDFGLSRSLSPSPVAAASMSREGTVSGTLVNMAPEQLRGLAASRRSDIFAFGVLAYELVAGQLPFRGPTTVDTIRNVLDRPHTSLRTIIGSAPLAFSELVDRTLAKSPHARPDSFEEVASTIERVLAELRASSDDAATSFETRHVALVCVRAEPGASGTPIARPRRLLEFQRQVRAVLSQVSAELVFGVDHEVVACIGYPRSHERNAVGAMEFIRTLERTLRPGEIPFGAGIDITEITVGVGDATPIFVGASVETVRALAGVASAGQILSTPTSRSQLSAGGFSVHTAPAEGPLGAYVVVSPDNEGPPIDEPIGRQGALDQLVREAELTLGPAGQRRGKIVAITGEPGIGKSTLVRSFLRSAPPIASARTVVTHAGAGDAYVPFRAARALLTGLCGGSDMGDDGLRARIATAGDDLASRLAAAAAAELAGVATPEERSLLAGAAARGESDVVATHAARFILGLLEPTPTTIVIEDLQWADPSSLVLLDVLVDNAARVPLLLVITHRTEFVRAWSPRARLHRVELERLSPADAEHLLQRCAGVERLSPATRAGIISRADGVPLWIEELAQAVTAQLASHAEVPPVVPASLRDTVQTRLQSVGAATRLVAELCAVVGGQVSLALLKVASGRAAEDLSADLDTLEQVGLVQRSGFVRTQTVSFRHALMESAVSAGVAATRSQLHAAVCRALESGVCGPPTETPELFAHHLEAAGRTSDAVEHWMVAAQRAAASWAHDGACAHYARALALLMSMPANPARAERERRLRIAYGRSLVAVDGLGGRLVEQNSTILLQLAGTNLAELHWLELLLNWASAYVTCDLSAMTAWTGALQDYVDRLEDPGSSDKALVQYFVVCIRGIVHYHLGQLPQSIAVLAEAETRRAGVVEALQVFPEKSIVVAPGTYAAMSFAIMGDRQSASECVTREEHSYAPESAERLTAQSIGGVTFTFLRDDAEAILRAQNVMSAPHTMLNPSHVEVARFNLGLAQLRERIALARSSAPPDDEVERILEALWANLCASSDTGLVIGMLLHQAMFAEAALDIALAYPESASLSKRARDLASAAITRASADLERPDVETLNRYIISEFHRVSARVYAAGQDRARSAQALELMDAAIDHVERASGRPPLELMALATATRASLARAELDQ